MKPITAHRRGTGGAPMRDMQMRKVVAVRVGLPVAAAHMQPAPIAVPDRRRP
ncbi:hypothetical protein SAMN05421774_10342 [Gemmobacter megaterium]|uniref:Uncharacterized protein n=1 Tax=Gemmobacter megaterium TaxID=1086013 RepID=A0A1N7N182_9RHOB|nr:hypothetical protein SAMN05421774_10342 [Gemmobacter megaterium]